MDGGPVRRLRYPRGPRRGRPRAVSPHRAVCVCGRHRSRAPGLGTLVTNLALYQVLVALGANEDLATRAAETSPVSSDLAPIATRADLSQWKAEIQAEVRGTVLSAVIALTAIYAGLLVVLGFFLRGV